MERRVPLYKINKLSLLNIRALRLGDRNKNIWVTFLKAVQCLQGSNFCFWSAIAISLLMGHREGGL